MHTITRLGTFDDVLADAAPDVAAICRALRARIEALHPDAVEVPRPGERSCAYGYGEKKMSEAYAYLMPQRAWVNLGFYHGAAIVASNPALEGTGKALRHLKVRTLGDVDAEVVTRALRDAMAERHAALGPDAG